MQPLETPLYTCEKMRMKRAHYVLYFCEDILAAWRVPRLCLEKCWVRSYHAFPQTLSMASRHRENKKQVLTTRTAPIPWLALTYSVPATLISFLKHSRHGAASGPLHCFLSPEHPSSGCLHGHAHVSSRISLKCHLFSESYLAASLKLQHCPLSHCTFCTPVPTSHFIFLSSFKSISPFIFV